MKNNYQTTSSARSKKQISNRALLLVILMMSTFSLKAQVPSYVPTNGLVGWWPFNGNANDESGNGNNGTVNGATLTNDRFGNINCAYNFDGVSSYIITNSFFNASNDFTLSCWINTNSNASQSILNTVPHTILGVGINPWWAGAGNLGFLYGSGSSNGWYNNNYYFSNPNAYLNIWNNHVIVKNGQIWKFYQNGALINTYSATANPSGIISQLVFGHCDPSICSETFSGKIDDISGWNRALTQQEITALYNGCQLSINTQPTNQNITINNNAQFIVNSTDPNATYQWQTDIGVGFQNLSSVGQYSGANNDTLTVSYVTFANNNQPFRCIINSGSCSDTSNVAVLTVNNNVGINEISNNNLFAIYPNPANAIINIKSDAQLIGKSYFIFDNLGKTILTGKITSENMSIDINNLSEGNYLIGIDGNSKKQSFKVIKN
jgi:hypothetical protein